MLVGRGWLSNGEVKTFEVKRDETYEHDPLRRSTVSTLLNLVNAQRVTGLVVMPQKLANWGPPQLHFCTGHLEFYEAHMGELPCGSCHNANSPSLLQTALLL